MKELFYQSAFELVKQIQNNEISATEVMQAHLNRIENVQPKINALTARFDAALCLDEAAKIDAAIGGDGPIKPLAGLPVAIKDLLKVKGLISSSGNAGFLKMGGSSEDATIVRRLRAAGAIIIGLTNVPEMCRGGDSDNLIYGRTNNPYDLSRTPGGSSGGSAAIVASGGVPLAIGSDGGGSLVQPSHSCGITCLKPTHGLMPPTGTIGGDTPGIIGQFISYGPMARSVQDLRLVLPILAGSDGISPYTIPAAATQPLMPLHNLRIAYFTDNGFSPASKEIQDVVMNAAYSLKAEVKSVSEARPYCISESYNLHWQLFLGGDRGQLFKSFLQALGSDKLSWEMQEFVRQAESCSFTVTELNQRMIKIDRFRQDMLLFMRDYDIIISPVFPKVAKPHGIGIKEISDFSYAMAHNLTGWPTVVVRCGTSSEGLPIGVLIAAKPWNEMTALAVGERLEQIHGGWQAPSLQ